MVRRASMGPRCNDQARDQQQPASGQGLAEGNKLARIAHVSGRIVRQQQILRLLIGNPHADGCTSQIPQVVGSTGAAGVGEADCDRVFFIWLKMTDPKLFRNFGENAKSGIGHTEQHFRM